MNQKPMPAQGPVDVNVGRHTPGPWEVVAGDDYRIEAAACVELQDAMDLNYLTGQRPADVLKMRFADIKDGALEVQQGKTTKKLRILLESDGQRTWLDANRWKYHTNRAGRPIVGRMYARLKLAGIEASALAPQAWAPDFSQIG